MGYDEGTSIPIGLHILGAGTTHGACWACGLEIGDQDRALIYIYYNIYIYIYIYIIYIYIITIYIYNYICTPQKRWIKSKSLSQCFRAFGQVTSGRRPSCCAWPKPWNSSCPGGPPELREFLGEGLSRTRQVNGRAAQRLVKEKYIETTCQLKGEISWFLLGPNQLNPWGKPTWNS